MTGLSTSSFQVHGVCSSGWEAVGQAFLENFTRRFERGGSVSVVFRGEKVVDLWAGIVDEDTNAPWQEDTLALVFSTTKGMAALCCAHAHAHGLLDYDMPVAEVWPEFAAAGKDEITIRQLLEHQAGLSVVPKVSLEELEDLDVMAEKIAKVTPLWEPGSAVGYHVYTQGMYVGELVRRITGKNIAEYFHEHFRDGLGIDYHMGLPDDEVYRTARIHMPKWGDVFASIPPFLAQSLYKKEVGTELPFLWRSQLPWTLSFRAMNCVPFLDPNSVEHFNDPRARRLVLPSAIGFTNARQLARLYGALALGGELDGNRIMDDVTWQKTQNEAARSKDKVLHQPNAFSFGFARPSVVNTLGEGERSFGFGGAGGSIGFADPDFELGFGYAMNTMWYRFRDPRFMALREASFRCARIQQAW
ncbi:MAG: beta-lactamase family protein [Deltaproteobacteria bacterium]|nr:beta-lactamase family protein [Deltaproteobacteria bacterium]